MKKLVRDKIPEIMVKQGKNPKIKILNDDERYDKALCKKLLEEVREFLNTDKNNEAILYEIADIIEVIDAICALRNYKKNEIIDRQLTKKNEYGGFEKRLFITLNN